MNLKVEDYYPSGKRFLLRFKEKGGKENELPVHHKLEELLDEYFPSSTTFSPSWRDVPVERLPGNSQFAA